MIEVLVVDEQKLFRSSIQIWIDGQEDMQVVGVADNSKDALDQIKAFEPDVVWLDIQLQKSSSIKVAQFMEDEYPHIKKIFLVERADQQMIIQAIAVGSDGFLTKKLQPEQLYNSIREAYLGRVILSGNVARVLVDYIREMIIDKKRFLSRRLHQEGIELTSRQLDVTYYLLEGFTNKQIAKQLFLSEGTVKNYVSSVYDRVGIHYREKLIHYLQNLIE